MTTRLSYLHPYPAMIADSLAEKLSDSFVTPGMRLLDPFCGTGRTLLAGARNGANCVGIDVNPLACLLVQAKSTDYLISELNNFLNEIEKDSPARSNLGMFDFERDRKVEWFYKESKKELADIITLINFKKRSISTIMLAGSVLSATVREVSYCRNDRWKLHRISASKRLEIRPSAKVIFSRRLRSVINEIKADPFFIGDCCAFVGDSRNLCTLLESENKSGPFDLVITSPPYGDSQTTVQYGGMSSICLGVISYIKGLEHLRMAGKEIDARCLGGRINFTCDILDLAHKKYSVYWRGSKQNEAAPRVYQYLFDLEKVCLEISRLVRRYGYVIMVVARRRVGNWRLHLDRFIEDIFADLNFKVESKECRKIKQKILPREVNRYARSKVIHDNHIKKILTICEEYILVLEKR